MSDKDKYFPEPQSWDWDDISALNVMVCVERDTFDGVTIRTVTLIDGAGIRYVVECKAVD